MTDLTPFQATDFDLKSWVNQACLRRPETEPLDRHLAELEMRLHLTMEDLDASLEDDSARALQRIPASVQELSHVKGNVANLKAEVERVLKQLEASASAAEQSVSLLVQVDRTKSRMDEACSTLKEATELAELFHKVDSVFASGNLQHMASLLGTMRRSLSLVANVPEFEGGLQRLEALEDRLQGIIEPHLSAALAERKGDKVQQLASFLASINRPASVGQLYNAARIASLQSLWDRYDPRPSDRGFSSWLLTFYDDVISAVEVELKWTASNLPDQHPDAVLQLLLGLFSRIDKSFHSRLSAELNSGGRQGAMSILARMQATADGFAHKLQQHMLAVPVKDLVSLLEAVYAPFEAQVARYGELEAQQLGAELEAIDLPSPSSDSTEAVVAGLKAAVPTAIALCQAAAERCSRCSQGTELSSLLLVADDALVEFIGSLKVMLRELREQALPAPQSGSSAASSEEASALLPLLTVAGALLSRIGLLDAHLRSEVADLKPLLDRAEAGGSWDLTPTVLRLRRSQGQQLVQLRTFVATAEDPRFSALANAASEATRFSESAHQLIYDLLMLKLKAELAVIPNLPSWQAAEPESKFNLPSFSAYPQAYATAAGEYLMMLPQLLETLLVTSEVGEGEETQIDADWLDKVAVGAAELYAAQLQQVPLLSLQGSQQLAADLEYFCNVLSALGVAVPPTLGTWQVAVGWTAEEFGGAAKAALDDGMVDRDTLQIVANARSLSIGGGSNALLT